MKYDYVSERTGPPITVRVPRDIIPALNKYATKRQEHFIVVTLGGDHSVLRVRLVSIGLVNRTLVHPREIFQPAILDNATSVILAHNHPSGNLQPSDEDVAVTKRMVDAGDLLGINVLDHIVFGKTGWLSFLEQCQMPHIRQTS